MSTENTGSQLDALKLMLTSAHELTNGLLQDPLVPRILRAFARLPAPDREPILRIVERDATWCRIAEQAVEMTGISVRPNPQASLYVHVLDAPQNEPLQRDIDVIGFGIAQFVNLMPMFFQEGVFEQWTAAARQLAAEAPEDVREYVRRMAREVLAIIEETDATS